MQEIKFITKIFEEIVTGIQACACRVWDEELKQTLVADYFVEVVHPVL